jgi:hypothetical protein
MTKSEQFAIDEWLFEYPKDTSFDDILYMIIEDDSEETIIPYVQGQSMTKRELADFISGTQTHFSFVTGEA